MSAALWIAAIIVVAFILLKVFLKTLKVFLLFIMIAILVILWWLFQQGRLFH